MGLRLLQKLAQLHQAGWVFGDLKPQNVLVSDYGQVELIDYGGVTSIGRASGNSSPNGMIGASGMQAAVQQMVPMMYLHLHYY